MNKTNIIVFLTVLILTGCSSSTDFNQKNTSKPQQQTATQQKYDKSPLNQCVQCVEGKSFEDHPCCTSTFEADCQKQNGVIRTSDLHPFFPGLLKGCYNRAPDAGKACSSNKDCLTGVCDLQSAINSNNCKLSKKTPLNNNETTNEFFKATYNCSSFTPGRCKEAIDNGINPGGISHSLKMNGTILTEIQEPGPIM